MSQIIPNSTPTPNFYYDYVQPLLDGDEWKTLSYAVRRIFGFDQYRELGQNRISLKAFVSGYVDSEGIQRDYGTGLCVERVSECLELLCKIGIMIEVAGNNARNEGRKWELELDDRKVDLRFLILRKQEQDEKRAARMQKMRDAKAQKRAEQPDDEGEVLCIEGQPSLTQKAAFFDTERGMPSTQKALIKKENRNKKETNISNRISDSAAMVMDLNQEGSSVVPATSAEPTKRGRKPKENKYTAEQRAQVASWVQALEDERGAKFIAGSSLCKRVWKEAYELLLYNPSVKDIHDLYRAMKRDSWWKQKDIMPINLANAYQKWVADGRPLQGATPWNDPAAAPIAAPKILADPGVFF